MSLFIQAQTQVKTTSRRRRPRKFRPRLPALTQIRRLFRRLRKAVAAEVPAIRRANRAAASASRDSLAKRREFVERLLVAAASFRAIAVTLEHEARVTMSQAAEIRKDLPKLLSPWRETVAGVEILVFEFGQALTARDAFAAALDLIPEETTVAKIGERRAFLPRLAADAVSAEATSPVVLLTRLRHAERRFMVWPGRQPRTLLAPRGGALVAHGGRAHAFYFPGTATMPAGTKIVLPAAAFAN